MVDINEAESAREVLEKIERVRGGTRARVRGAWFPLVVFGLITLATIALYSRPFAYPGRGGGFDGGPYVAPYYAGLPGARSQLVAYMFWLVVAPLGYLACAAWYRRRARRLGVSFHWERWVGAGLGLFGLLMALLAMPLSEPGRRIGRWVESGRPSAAVDFRADAVGFLTPLVAVAIGLLVLAWVERSWIVAAVAVLYGGLTVVVNTYGLGQIPPWIKPPHGATRDFFVAPAHNLVVLALLLFVGAGVFAIWTRLSARAQ
ncbi:MAG TPA: hypothetical protein VF711_10075 [Acidimicrobiales bacterium]|jgi:hypothetical protein